MKLSIIIPIYNEARTVDEIIKRVLSVKYPVPYEVILIDDASSDESYQKISQLAQRYGGSNAMIRVFKNQFNHGKGFSIRRALHKCEGDYVIVQDADTEYDPQDIPSLLAPVLAGKADFVVGSRFRKKWYPEGMAFPNWVANILLTFFSDLLFFSALTDVYSCYKIIPVPLMKSFRLRWNRFESESEIIANLLKSRVRVCEVPIRYQGRTAEQGKKIKAKDFFIGVYVLILERFNYFRLRKRNRIS